LLVQAQCNLASVSEPNQDADEMNSISMVGFASALPTLRASRVRIYDKAVTVRVIWR
jgi:hypothetical protein